MQAHKQWQQNLHRCLHGHLHANRFDGYSKQLPPTGTTCRGYTSNIKSEINIFLHLIYISLRFFDHPGLSYKYTKVTETSIAKISMLQQKAGDKKMLEQENEFYVPYEY